VGCALSSVGIIELVGSLTFSLAHEIEQARGRNQVRNPKAAHGPQDVEKVVFDGVGVELNEDEDDHATEEAQRTAKSADIEGAEGAIETGCLGHFRVVTKDRIDSSTEVRKENGHEQHEDGNEPNPDMIHRLLEQVGSVVMKVDKCDDAHDSSNQIDEEKEAVVEGFGEHTTRVDRCTFYLCQQMGPGQHCKREACEHTPYTKNVKSIAQNGRAICLSKVCLGRSTNVIDALTCHVQQHGCVEHEAIA